MLHQPVRRIATTALCATFLLGTAAPAIAAESDPGSSNSVEALRAPVPGADALLGQVGTLGSMSSVVTPVTDLLTEVLKADDGKLTAEAAQKHADAIKAAIDAAKATVPATTTTPKSASPTTPRRPGRT